MANRFSVPDFVKTLPNKLTIGRIAIIPVLLILYPLDIQFFNIFCAILFAIAALTDFADGYIARRYNTESRLGAILDPLADKILVTATIVLLTNAGNLPAFLAALLLCREVAVTGMRLVAMEHSFTIQVNQFGKLKTAAQDLGIFFLLLKTPEFHTIGMIAIWVALGLSYYSAYQYWKELWQTAKHQFN